MTTPPPLTARRWHPFFRECYAQERPLIDAMLDLLTLAAGTVHNRPAQGRDCSERTDGHGHIRGMCMASAPADGLPGEPVEPGDLRAGDRVAFTWEATGERIVCTLVSVREGAILRSDTPDKDDYYPNVVVQGKWCSAISDVRLIERAPREDDDPDEALAKVLWGAFWIGTDIDAKWELNDERPDWLRVARAAREHIEGGSGADVERLTRERDAWQDVAKGAGSRANSEATHRAAAEARYEALREDVAHLHRSHIRTSEAQGARRILARDDERGEQA